MNERQWYPPASRELWETEPNPSHAEYSQGVCSIVWGGSGTLKGLILPDTPEDHHRHHQRHRRHRYQHHQHYNRFFLSLLFQSSIHSCLTSQFLPCRTWPARHNKLAALQSLLLADTAFPLVLSCCWVSDVACVSVSSLLSFLRAPRLCRLSPELPSTPLFSQMSSCFLAQSLPSAGTAFLLPLIGRLACVRLAGLLCDVLLFLAL